MRNFIRRVLDDTFGCVHWWRTGAWDSKHNFKCRECWRKGWTGYE